MESQQPTESHGEEKAKATQTVTSPEATATTATTEINVDAPVPMPKQPVPEENKATVTPEAQEKGEEEEELLPKIQEAVTNAYTAVGSWFSKLIDDIKKSTETTEASAKPQQSQQASQKASSNEQGEPSFIDKATEFFQALFTFDEPKPEVKPQSAPVQMNWVENTRKVVIISISSYFIGDIFLSI